MILFLREKIIVLGKNLYFYRCTSNHTDNAEIFKQTGPLPVTIIDNDSHPHGYRISEER